jgi:hypothetical protein
MSTAIAQLPTVSGLFARFYGGNSSSPLSSYVWKYYWIQTIYPEGRSGWIGCQVKALPNLDNSNKVNISWNAMDGAIGYDVVTTSALTNPTLPPTGTANILLVACSSSNSWDDTGIPPSPYTVQNPILFATIAAFSDGEIPSGVINGINNIFTLVNTPNPALSLLVLRNGVQQEQGVAYTVSGNTISFTLNPLYIPQTGDVIQAWYRYSI